MGIDNAIKYIAWAILATALAGCVPSQGTRIDNIPMYGQPEIERPAFLKQADQDFIRDASAGIGSRQQASKVWHAEGERYMNEGNLDYAMRRYNQAWLLDPDNYQPYWGFGRVLLEQGKVDQAIRQLEQAEALIDDDYQKVALLADIGTAYSRKAQQSPDAYAVANRKFSQSVALDPGYPESWRRWAYSLYRQGSYAEAWDKVKQAQRLNAKPFHPAFLSDLRQKAPEPD